MSSSRPPIDEDFGCYVISVAAEMLRVHPQTLRYYERAGLLTPARSKGNVRRYSMRNIAQAQQIKRLIQDLGVNLAGVEAIVRLSERVRELEAEVDELRAAVASQRRRS
ncbi:MAG TPA: helix-turn-helix transcriptional regulator [Chloroflexota bacterium]|nr:helix-turn-helix transcriptional regulator [Chloroflexota bacterium]